MGNQDYLMLETRKLEQLEKVSFTSLNPELQTTSKAYRKLSAKSQNNVIKTDDLDLLEMMRLGLNYSMGG